MQIKNFKYILSIASFVVIGSSCSTIYSIGKTTKKWKNEVKTKVYPIIKKDTIAPKTGNTTLVRFTLPSLKSNKPKVKKVKPVEEEVIIAPANNTNIEFLENIAVKPGKIYLNKTSDSIDAEPSPAIQKDNYEKMPENLSDIEKANWLQLKYSIKMDVAVEEINNIPLLTKIDEWWGTPYCLGGSSKGCIDCSYFTLDVMKATYNINLKRTAAEQYEQSEKIDWADLKEGDLIFFKTEGRKNITHVGIYLTNNKFAHASTSQGVTISDLTESYWQKRLYSLGRVSATPAQ
jgi:lipoprotein Spr